MIKFNEVTWYSKLAAVIFFLGIFPVWTFYIGTVYQNIVNENKVVEQIIYTTHTKGETDTTDSIIPNQPTSEVGKLKIGEIKKINNVNVTLTSVNQDNRCPVDVQCIRAGDVTVGLHLEDDFQKKDTQLVSTEVYDFKPYSISIENIDPLKSSTVEIDPSDYEITIKVEKNN